MTYAEAGPDRRHPGTRASGCPWLFSIFAALKGCLISFRFRARPNALLCARITS